LYADRKNPDSARRALEMFAADAAAQPNSFEAAWKLARACYWVGNHAPNEKERKKALDQGIDAGRKAAALEPRRPEGHFWMAANMGTMAEAAGLTAGLKYRGTIRSELETVLKLDPAFMEGSADRALGRWYFKVPRLFGGSNKTAEKHLRASLARAPDSTVSHYFLAEVLIDEDRRAEAGVELQKVIDAPYNAGWAAEDEDYKSKARALLATLKK